MLRLCQPRLELLLGWPSPAAVLAPLSPCKGGSQLTAGARSSVRSISVPGAVLGCPVPGVRLAGTGDEDWLSKALVPCPGGGRVGVWLQSGSVPSLPRWWLSPSTSHQARAACSRRTVEQGAAPSLPPSPGTHHGGEGSFPGPSPQPQAPSLIAQGFLPAHSCTPHKSNPSPRGAPDAADPTHGDHLAELLPSLSLQQPSAKDAGRVMGWGGVGRGCSLPSPGLFPGTAGFQLTLAAQPSSALLLFSPPAPSPGEEED